MKNAKWMIGLGLALSLVSGILAGCGPKEEPQAQSTPAAAPSPAAAIQPVQEQTGMHK